MFSDLYKTAILAVQTEENETVEKYLQSFLRKVVQLNSNPKTDRLIMLSGVHASSKQHCAAIMSEEPELVPDNKTYPTI